MVFNSESQLRRYILDKCKIAVYESEQKVHRIIDDILKDFYNEYSPDEYIRTHQLLHSLVKSDVKSTGAGYVAEVFFEASKLNYPNPAKGKSGMYHDVEKTSGQILENVMVGAHPHGWYEPAGGTGIWTKAQPILNAQVIGILKHSLQANGIPIK